MPICGHGLMLDELEIALGEHPVFLKWLNSVGGLCREHTIGLSDLMSNVPALKSLADAIFGPSPTVHYAKEAAVAGIVAFRLGLNIMKLCLCSFHVPTANGRLLNAVT
jgi:hypothetical protein